METAIESAAMCPRCRVPMAGPRCVYCGRREGRQRSKRPFVPGAATAYRSCRVQTIRVNGFEVDEYVYDQRNKPVHVSDAIRERRERQRRSLTWMEIDSVVEGGKIRGLDHDARRPLPLHAGRRTIVALCLPQSQQRGALHVKYICRCGATGVMTARSWRSKVGTVALRGPYCELCAEWSRSGKEEPCKSIEPLALAI